MLSWEKTLDYGTAAGLPKIIEYACRKIRVLLFELINEQNRPEKLN